MDLTSVVNMLGAKVTTMPGLMIPVSTLPTGTVPIPPILYTSWRGSLRGLSVGLGTISMGANVGTISIPYSMEEYDEGTICTVSGWGTTTEGGSLARVLQKVDVPVVSDDHCRDSYG